MKSAAHIIAALTISARPERSRGAYVRTLGQRPSTSLGTSGFGAIEVNL